MSDEVEKANEVEAPEESGVHAHVQKANEVVGARLSGMAEAKARGMKRDGLNAGDIEWAVNLLQAGKGWDAVTATLGKTITPETLEGWKPALFEKAGVTE